MWLTISCCHPRTVSNVAFATNITLKCIPHNCSITKIQILYQNFEFCTTISESQQMHAVRYNGLTRRAINVRIHIADWFISPAREVP